MSGRCQEDRVVESLGSILLSPVVSLNGATKVESEGGGVGVAGGRIAG